MADQIRTQILDIRRGDSYSGTIYNSQFRWIVPSSVDLTEATAYLTVKDRLGNLLFQLEATPTDDDEDLETGQYAVAFAPTVAETLPLPLGARACKWELSVVLDDTYEETPFSGWISVSGDLDQQVTIPLIGLTLIQALYLSVELLNSVTI
jgi:hypothetical protein